MVSQNYLDINVLNARAGQIKPLRRVLREIADCLRDNRPVPRPHALLLADSLESLVESLKGVNTQRWAHLYTDDPKERSRLKQERKAALEKTGRLFNRAFFLAQNPGRPSLETDLEMLGPMNEYCRLRMYGETKDGAIESVCRITEVEEETLRRHLKKKAAEPSVFDRRDSRFALARLYHRYMRGGATAGDAKRKVASLRRGLSVKAVERSIRLFDDHAIMELIRRQVEDGVTFEQAATLVSESAGIREEKAQSLGQKLERYELAKEALQRAAAGSSLEDAVDVISRREAVSTTVLMRTAKSMNGYSSMEFLVAQHYFVDRDDIEQLAKKPQPEESRNA